MHVRGKFARQSFAMDCVLINPIKSRQFKILIFRFRKIFQQTVYIPFACLHLVGTVVEIERIAVERSPVGLSGQCARYSEHHLMLESRIAELFFLSLDTFVQGIKRLPFFKDTSKKPLPFRLAGFLFPSARSIGISLSVVELKEKETVEQPIFMAVGKSMGHIRDKLVLRPFDAVRTALINQGKVAHIAHFISIPAIAFCKCGHTL